MDEKETLMYEKGQTIRKRAKNKIFGVIYSRTAVVIILLLLQIELMLFSLTYLENYTNYLYGVFVILSVVSVIYIMNEKGTPEFKMTWLLFILLVPVVEWDSIFLRRPNLEPIFWERGWKIFGMKQNRIWSRMKELSRRCEAADLRM